MTLEFNNTYEAYGAENIIKGLLVGSDLTWYNINVNGNNVDMSNIPQAIIDIAEEDENWVMIEAIGRQIVLEEYITHEAPEIFYNAEDKNTAVIEIVTNLQEIINIQL